MGFRHLMAVGLPLLALATATLGLAGLGVTLLILAAATLALAAILSSRVQVPPFVVAVVLSSGDGTFRRLLPPGVHWLRPWRERLGRPLSTAPVTQAGESPPLQLGGGVQVSVAWSLSYRLNPFRLPAATAAHLAPTLAQGAPALVRRHLEHALQQVVGALPPAEACRPGALRRLELERIHRLGQHGVGLVLGPLSPPPEKSRPPAHPTVLYAQ